LLTPNSLPSETCKIGIAKVSRDNFQVIVLSLLAGMFIGLGYYGYIVIAGGANGSIFGKLLGAAVFPIGLVMIIIAGGELFTGNCLVTLGFMDRHYKIKLVIKNLIIVFIGNFIGALFLVTLIYFSNVTGSTKNFIVELGEIKVGYSFIEALSKGILCNILVSLAVYMSYAAKTVSGKIIVASLPILLFVISGFEHSVANMFLLPLSKLLNADISIYDILIRNLLPVTIGNLIGGSIVVPGAYYLIYVKKAKQAKE